MMRFIIGPIVCDQVNLDQNEFVAGLPSPMAAIGFASALVRRMAASTPDGVAAQLNPWAVSVIPVLHSVTVSTGRRRSAPTRGPASNGFATLKAVEVQENLSGHATLSLIIDFKGDVETSEIAHALRGMRFAGGTISAPGYDKQAIKIARIDTDTLRGIQVGRGYAMIPAAWRENCSAVSFGEELGLQNIFDRVTEKSKDGGYLVPVASGLRLLENPADAKVRSGSRDDHTPHVFSEPGAGIAEMVSIRNPRLLDATIPDIEEITWTWARDAANTHVMFSNFHLQAVA